MEKIAVDPRKGRINLKSLEENETSENCLLQEPEENFKECIAFKISLRFKPFLRQITLPTLHDG